MAERVGLHNLKPKPGSRRPRKRLGRGKGSGLGKTSGRGHKGAGQRSGNKRKRGYEGGQNPIHMRMAKLRGPNKKMSMPFENFRTRTQPVNLSDLQARFKAGDEVTPESLREAGLAKRRDPVKILARGELKLKLHVKAHGFSAAAREAIEKAGGTVEFIGGEPPKPAPPGSMEAPKEEKPKEKAPKDKKEAPKEKAPKEKEETPKEVEAPAGDAAESALDDAGGDSEDASSDGEAGSEGG
jgi:large subunit ribosomal protein L15